MIIINARFLTQPITGVQRFAIEICRGLKKSNIPLEFVAPNNILHKDIAEELGVKIIPGSILKGHLWEQIELQFYAYKKKTLLLSLCNTAPIFIKNQIVTVHDLGFRVHPEWVSKVFSTVYNIIIPKVCRTSKKVITVSQTSKEEIINELQIPEDKIEVVYNAVSDKFHKENGFLTEEDKDLMEENYILTVSSHHPRKNFERLIKAFLKLPDKTLKLYIIGNVNKHFLQDIIPIDNKRIKLLKGISDYQLIHFYRNTKLFVYPSLYEGFGIPIIEALSQGASVCVSDIPVFKEICGESVIYFDPLNTEDIRVKMNLALHSEVKSRVDLSKYNWDVSAKQIEKCIFENI